MRTPATRFWDLVVGKRPTSLCLRPTVCLGRSLDLKLMAYRLNFGALPFPLPRNLRKGSRNADKRTNQLLEEVSKLLEAYWQAILNSDS